MQKFILALAIVIFLCQSCETIKNSSKYTFTEGYYKGRLEHKKISVYIIPGDDSVKIYTEKSLHQQYVDTASSLKKAFPGMTNHPNDKGYSFYQNSFDLDFISILVKYRPRVGDFPNVFNTSILNGAIYVGFRKDLYHLKYHETPFRTYKREITHYGFSFGLFTGLGTARIDEYVTLNRINIEYDGLVNPTGFAAILAVDKLTFGLLIGEDHLLDHNHDVWIYQGKPWLGISVGLNLN